MTIEEIFAGESKNVGRSRITVLISMRKPAG